MEENGNMKVSIFCLTYNHSQYIRDALEGMLNQKTSFAYNILVFDDASSDGTSEILREYQGRYNDILTVYTAMENTYEKLERGAILQELYEKYRVGEYIAWCEGDDVWTDEHKLQMQTDYMEQNAQCVMTTHAYMVEDCFQKTKSIIRPGGKNSRYLSAEEVILQLQGNFATASFVMRRAIFFRDKEYPVGDVEDYPLQLYALCRGRIFYFDRVMSVYRYMHEGSWTWSIKRSTRRKILHILHSLAFLKAYDKYSGFKYTDLIKKRKIEYLYWAVPLELPVEEYEVEKESLYALDSEGSFGRIDQVDQIYYWLKGLYRFGEEIRSRVDACKYICIMGNGNYAKIVEDNLKKNGISYVGHIVSSLNGEESEAGLWEIKTYPYEHSETMVIVGISQMKQDGILCALEEAGFRDILTPLWFEDV